ncbi:MAG: hydrogenase maturation protease [Deltaproteobacteria bacterium]|nr:hydrogenase maturation protease [Deltaproteobacteria bacterium]
MKSSKKTIILGVGNTVLTDDGVGVYAARRAKEMLGENTKIDVKEAEIAGFDLLDLLDGYERAVIIDALKRPGHAPGKISQHRMDDFSATSHLISGHQIDLPTAIELGRELDRSPPGEIHIVCVQVADDFTFAERCTPEVEQSIEPAAKLAVDLAQADPICSDQTSRHVL